MKVYLVKGVKACRLKGESVKVYLVKGVKACRLKGESVKVYLLKGVKACRLKGGSVKVYLLKGVKACSLKGESVKVYLLKGVKACRLKGESVKVYLLKGGQGPCTNCFNNVLYDDCYITQRRAVNVLYNYYWFKLRNQSWRGAVLQSDILDIHNFEENSYQYDTI